MGHVLNKMAKQGGSRCVRVDGGVCAGGRARMAEERGDQNGGVASYRQWLQKNVRMNNFGESGHGE